MFPRSLSASRRQSSRRRSPQPHALRLPVPVDASKLKIVEYPHPALRQRASKIDRVTDEVRSVARRMIELMREAEGVGLAAPQVALPWRLFVADVPEDDNRSASSDPPTATRGPVVYINPALSHPAGGLEGYEEGCLSLPDIRGEVLRPPVMTITAIDLEGQAFTQTAGGLLARCWQHECDHLDGVLILDKFTQLSRLKNKFAVRDLERRASRDK